MLFFIVSKRTGGKEVQLIYFCNCLGAHSFCHKMSFLRLFLLKFSHVALLRIENCIFNIHKNADFLPENRST